MAIQDSTIIASNLRSGALDGAVPQIKCYFLALVSEREMLSLSFYILCSLTRNLQFLVKSLTAQRKSL